MTTKRRKVSMDARGGLNKTEKKQVGKMIDRKTNLFIETKEVDIQQTSAVITAGAGLLIPITGIIAGSDNSQRIGLEIRPTIIDFYFEWIADTLDPTNLVRLTLVQWFSDDAIDVPSLAKIFEDIANVRPLLAFNFTNKGKNKKFRVLFDRIYTLSDQQGPLTKASRIRLFGRKLPNVIAYNSAGGTNGKNKVYLVLWSDSTVGGPVFKMHGMFAYKDA